MKEDLERRVSERVARTLPGSYRPGRSLRGPPPRASTVDLSQGGLRLRVTHQSELVKKDDPIYVQVGGDDDDSKITIQGQVRWLKPSPGSKKEWDIGVRLASSELARWAVWLEQTSTTPGPGHLKP